MESRQFQNRALRSWLPGVLAAAAIWLPTPALSVGFVISEILFETDPDNDGWQWIELYNGTGAPIDLDEFSLGWGRNDYTHGTVSLTGNLDPGETFLIGGPNSEPDNGDPVYDVLHNFEKDLRKGNKGQADGIALFEDAVSTTIPYFSVIYGKDTAVNDFLLDETGSLGTIAVKSAKFQNGESLEFLPSGSWVVATAPSPGSFNPTPEPTTGVLLASGLALLAIYRQRRRGARLASS